MSEIVKEKPIMEEAHKRYNNFIRNRLMRRLSACGVSEYDKKELYQYDKKIMLADERRIGMRQGIKKGIKENSYAIAKTLKQMNMDDASISKATGLSIEEICKLKTDE